MIDRDGPGEGLDGTFGRVVDGHAGVGVGCRDRRDVDDDAAVGLARHVTHRSTAHVEHAPNVHVHDEVEFLVGGVGHSLFHLHAGVVDHDVQLSEPLHSSSHQRIGLRRIGDIGL